MLALGMRVRLRQNLLGGLIGLVVMLGSACQSGGSPAPTAATPAPTSASVPTSAPVSPSVPAAAQASPSAGVSAAPSPIPSARPAASAPSPASTTVPPAATASRVEVLNAAEAAFARGDAANAGALYERVTNTPPGQGETAAGSAAIDDYARFRGMLALLVAGREADARAQLDELQSRDPNSPLARLGAQLWDQYGMTAQLRPACAQLQPQVASQAGPILATLGGLGVTVDPSRVCSVP